MGIYESLEVHEGTAGGSWVDEKLIINYIECKKKKKKKKKWLEDNRNIA